MKSMHIRDFMRGGYREITEPTVITRHGRGLATWIPWGISLTELVAKQDRPPTRKSASR